jgi:hypothetical protein
MDAGELVCAALLQWPPACPPTLFFFFGVQAISEKKAAASQAAACLSRLPCGQEAASRRPQTAPSD